MGSGASFLGVERPGRDTDNTPTCSAELRVSGTRPVFPVYDFMVGTGELVSCYTYLSPSFAQTRYELEF